MPEHICFIDVVRRCMYAFIVIFLVACSAGTPFTSPGSQLSSSPYSVDAQFREFYDALGGEPQLGQAISPVFISNDTTYQYTASVLMVHDPQAPTSQQFHLAALGQDLGLSEPPPSDPVGPDEFVVKGYVIFPAFVNIYKLFEGEKYAGNPLSSVHYNPELKRFEQYFENVGFYRLENDPQNVVHTLNYGAEKCRDSCWQPAPSSSNLILPRPIDAHFTKFARNLGTSVTGFAINDAVQASDGSFEQVFQNVVITTDPKHDHRVSLCPITEKLGILPEPLATPALQSGERFYQIEDGRGYDVPQEFMDYINRHGGIDISGPPIDTLSLVKENVYRQCFRNYCLERDDNLTGINRIRLAPLGYMYARLQITGQPQAGGEQGEGTPPGVSPQAGPSSEISLQVWETYPMVEPGQSQEIGVQVYTNNVPLPQMAPELTINLPDGTTRTYQMPPTAEDGQSKQSVEPISAANGTIIPYQICIALSSGESYCVQGDYLIWKK